MTRLQQMARAFLNFLPHFRVQALSTWQGSSPHSLTLTFPQLLSNKYASRTLPVARRDIYRHLHYGIAYVLSRACASKCHACRIFDPVSIDGYNAARRAK